jgi:vacuolar-type H+-ATPase subunit I/STV1
MTTKLNEVNDILNFDVVLRRKKYLETCLLAELKQLNELEEHEQNLQLSYNLDLEYLHQLKKTTGKQEQDMIKKINEKREELSLDEVEQIYDGINLTDTPNLFNPQDDDDVVLLLTKLNQHLTNVQNSSKQLGHLNDKVEVVNNILDML